MLSFFINQFYRNRLQNYYNLLKVQNKFRIIFTFRVMI